MRLCSVCRNQTRKVWHGITQTRMTRRATEAALSREGALIRIFDAPCVLRRPLRGARCLRHQQGQAPCADCIGYPMMALCAKKRR